MVFLEMANAGREGPGVVLARRRAGSLTARRRAMRNWRARDRDRVFRRRGLFRRPRGPERDWIATLSETRIQRRSVI